MNKRLEEALKRIEALEAEVARLKAAGQQQWHYHYHWPPAQPVLGPTWTYPQIWMGGGARMIGSGGSND